MSRMYKIIFAVALCWISANSALGQAAEQTTTGRDRQSVNITVYNSNLGLVRETRRLTLSQGQVALRFADVTAQIRPETVHLSSLTAPASLRILEQNYQYDLLNPAKLLDKFVGREITLVLRHYQNNTETFEPVQATLLSNNGGQVWRINGQIVINPTNISEIRFPDLPKNLVATPTLVWDLENRESGPQTVEASYLTSGMNWRADYVLLVNADDTRGDLQGWVTLTNASGANFEVRACNWSQATSTEYRKSESMLWLAPCNENQWPTPPNFRSRASLNIIFIRCSDQPAFAITKRNRFRC